MSTRLPRRPLTVFGGVSVIALYCCFLAISWAFYPDAFSPLTHYLSRLGNFNYSPLGAYFYNLGCILTGVALFPFFVGLRIWYTDKKYQVLTLTFGQLLGICSAVALIMIGVFSEDKKAPHMTASSLFFLLNFLVLILVNLALVWHPQFMKPIAIYGFGIDLLSLVLEFAIGGPIVEWFTVFGALAFVGFVSVNSLRLLRQETPSETDTDWQSYLD